MITFDCERDLKLLNICILIVRIENDEPDNMASVIFLISEALRSCTIQIADNK